MIFKYLFLVILLTYVNSYSQENVIEITDPIRDSIEVECQYNVKGKAVVSSGSYIWLLAHRTAGFKEVWWPQEEAAYKDGTWSAQVVFGGKNDIGYEFEIAAIAVNQRNNIMLQNYRKNALLTGDWRPIEMPETILPPAIVKVVKVGHNGCN